LQTEQACGHLPARADPMTPPAPVSNLDDMSASENEVFAKENAWSHSWAQGKVS